MELIFDGNALLHVITNQAISIFKQNYSDEMDSADTEGEELSFFLKKEYSRILFTFINSYIFPFKDQVSHVHIVLDNKSWRKEYVNKFFEKNPTHNSFVYKGTRKKDKNYILLNKFFKLFHDSISDKLKAIPGVFVYSTIGAEGDDIIAYLTEKFATQDIAIWTGDQDIGQLATNVNRKVIILGPRHIKTKMRRVSVNKHTPAMDFNFNVQLNESIDYLLRSRFYEKIELLPGKNLLTKIVTRDVSDNIGSIYVRFNKKGNAMNITPKRGEKFLQTLFDKYNDADILKRLDEEDNELFEDVLSCLSREFKFDLDDSELVEKIKKNYYRNIKLTRLNKSHIPEILYKMIERIFEHYYNLGTAFNYAEFAANFDEIKKHQMINA